MRKKLINYINKYLKNKSVSDIINNKKGIEKVNRKGEKNMTKTFDYKSSFIKFEDDKKGIKAIIVSPQNKTEIEFFKTVEDAKDWAVSRAECFDRLPYSFRY